jgi:hypothetical protein
LFIDRQGNIKVSLPWVLKLIIETKDLNPGLNKIRFKLISNYSPPVIDIYELRFDLPEITKDKSDGFVKSHISSCRTWSGIQNVLKSLDSGFRRNDEKLIFRLFTNSSKLFQTVRIQNPLFFLGK